MPRYAGLHTLPGFTKEMLAQATPALNHLEATFVRAISGFKDGKVVCEWEAADKETVARAYSAISFPYDEIVEVEAICDAGEPEVTTRYM